MPDRPDGSPTATAGSITAVIAEHAETVRGKARYFFVTDVGVMHAIVSREPETNRGRDAHAIVSVYDPAREDSWRYVAGLGYHEMTSREMPVHGTLDHWMDRLRADAEAVIERAAAIIDHHRAAQDGDAS